MKRFIFQILVFSSCIFTSLSSFAQDIIPKPVEITKGNPNQFFSLSSSVNIKVQDSLFNPSAEYLRQYLLKYFKLNINIQDSKTQSHTILNSDHKSINFILNEKLSANAGHYKLEVNSNSIDVYATSAEASFYAVQSLIQLLPTQSSSTGPIKIQTLKINDYPRFQYRGMHLDVSRHFFGVDFIKKYIDYLALHKINYFHWHLTDDQGWRIEIRKYPKLNSIASWREGTIIGLFPGKGNEHIKYQVLPDQIKITPENPTIKTDGVRYGGYYTQSEVKEVIDYATSRFITIIPEIEMPAHNMAVLAAYPELGTEPNLKKEVAVTWGMFNKYNNVLQAHDKTFAFLEDVLTEVIALFPSKYIHIGGDEAAKVWWKNSKETQQIMKTKGIENEAALQSYFIQRIEKFLNSKGKTLIGWDEILDGGLAPNAVVMSWRGEKGGISAAKQKHQVIMTPENTLYFNHSQFVKEDSVTVRKLSSLESVYKYDPVPAVLNTEESSYIWGAQANLWTEYINNWNKVEYMIFPRIAALSEITWTDKKLKNYDDFLLRLQTQLKRYTFWGINYSKAYENSSN